MVYQRIKFLGTFIREKKNEAWCLSTLSGSYIPFECYNILERNEFDTSSSSVHRRYSPVGLANARREMKDRWFILNNQEKINYSEFSE
ncbi:hypothetical protein SK128_027159 [Halocaridina rubra]|uniref:Uncharacterized protein n=1 Tax=Halocaridina rubra TaxID=373956 RepID=A0AAN8XAB7_HALRR